MVSSSTWLMPSGPQSGSASTNYPRGIENGVNWCTDLLEHMIQHDLRYAEATAEAEQRWTDLGSQDVFGHADEKGAVLVHRLQQQRRRTRGGEDSLHGLQRRNPKYVVTINDVAAEKDYEGIRFFAESEPPRRRRHSR